MQNQQKLCVRLELEKEMPEGLEVQLPIYYTENCVQMETETFFLDDNKLWKTIVQVIRLMNCTHKKL